MKAYLVQVRHLQPPVAEDLVQGFIASKVLERGLLAHADSRRGRFRAFLLSALSTYVAEQHRYDSRAVRSPVGGLVALRSVPEPQDESTDPQRIFDVAWARQVLIEALNQMQFQCTAGGRPELWAVFDGRVVGPTLEQAPATPYPELVRQHGLDSPEQASNLLMTAKRLFRRSLRAVVRGYAADEIEVDEEIADLERILSRAR